MKCCLGDNREKSLLSWESRFRIAVGIAEAVNFLHGESSRPVIHRDIKSSNILLSDDFEPQVDHQTYVISFVFRTPSRAKNMEKN